MTSDDTGRGRLSHGHLPAGQGPGAAPDLATRRQSSDESPSRGRAWAARGALAQFAFPGKHSRVGLRSRSPGGDTGILARHRGANSFLRVASVAAPSHVLTSAWRTLRSRPGAVAEPSGLDSRARHGPVTGRRPHLRPAAPAPQPRARAASKPAGCHRADLRGAAARATRGHGELGGPRLRAAVGGLSPSNSQPDGVRTPSSAARLCHGSPRHRQRPPRPAAGQCQWGHRADPAHPPFTPWPGA